MLILNKEIEELISIQQSLPLCIEERTRCDVKDMIKHFPNTPLQNIIDLGCGSGRISIGLNYILKDKNIKYWLVDGEDSDPKQYWGQYSLGEDTHFYNKKKLTTHFCHLNNFLNYKYITVKPDLTWTQFPPLSDILFSKYAVGWHFPINTYYNIYPKILKKGALCFFTIRQENKNTLPEYKLSNLPPFFEIINIFTDSFHWTGKEEKIDCGNGRRTLLCRYKGRQ